MVEGALWTRLRGCGVMGGVSRQRPPKYLATAARLCTRIAVLYAGRIVESARTTELLASPRHPYPLGLLRSLPPPLGSSGPVRLQPIAGSAPPPWERPGGCRFRNRCPRAQDDCAKREPELIEIDGRGLACFHPVDAP